MQSGIAIIYCFGTCLSYFNFFVMHCAKNLLIFQIFNNQIILLKVWSWC